MENEKELPKRKHPRLKNYDYSSSGAYFITICTENRKKVLSRIENVNPPSCEDTNDVFVGRGLAPAVFSSFCEDANKDFVGRGLAPAVTKGIEYTKYGQIAEKQLLLLEERYSFLKIDKYVIMPNHIHAILIMGNETAGASPRPTIIDVVYAYKSLTTIECRKNGLTDGLFQTSFFEHVIRNQDDHYQIRKYIHDNPAQWYFDELYSE